MVTTQLPQVLSELAEFNLRRFGEYTMVYYEGRAYTNTELAEQARRLGAGLQTQGVQAGRPGNRDAGQFAGRAGSISGDCPYRCSGSAAFACIKNVRNPAYCF